MTRNRVITAAAEIDAVIEKARASENDRPRAIEAYYDQPGDKVVIRLASGVDVAIPRTHLQGLEKATGDQVDEIQLEGAGSTGRPWMSTTIYSGFSPA